MGANSSRPDGVDETSSPGDRIISTVGLGDGKKNGNPQTDVEVKYDGEIVSHSHRLVLSAFSRRFKNDLLAKQQLRVITLDYYSAIGISKEALKELIDYCSTGQYKISQSLLDAAKYLQCENLISLLENAIEAPSSSSTITEALTDPRHAANFLEALCQMRIDNEFVETDDPIQDSQPTNRFEEESDPLMKVSEHKNAISTRIAEIEGGLKLKSAEFEKVKPASDTRRSKYAKAILRHLLLGSKTKFDPYKNIFKLIAQDPYIRKTLSEALGELPDRFLEVLKSMWASWRCESDSKKEEFDHYKTESQREKNIRVTQIEGELNLKLAEIRTLKKQVGGIECERQKIQMEYALQMKLFDVEKLKRDLEYEKEKWRLAWDAKKAEFDRIQRESQREKISRLRQIEFELKLKLAEIETYKKCEGDLIGLTKKTKNTVEEIEDIKKIEEFLAEIKPKQLVKDILVETRDVEIGKSTGQFEYYQDLSKSKTGTASGLVRPNGKRESNPRPENINIKKSKIVLERNDLSEGMDANKIIGILHALHLREKNHLKKLCLEIKSDGTELTLKESTTTPFYRHQSRDFDQLEQALRNLIPNTFVEEIRILLVEEPNEQCFRLIDTIFHVKCARLIVDKFNERKLNTPQATLSTLLALENDHSGYTKDDRNDIIFRSLSGQDLVELNERNVNIPQITLFTIVTLAENTRDVRINAICPSLTAQDLFRLREIMWDGDCKLKYFSVVPRAGMKTSFLNECYGVTIEQRLDTPRYKIYRTEDKFSKLWYHEDVFCPVYHFEGNLKTTIGSELFVSEKIEGGAISDEGYRNIVWNHRYEEGSIDVEGVDDDDDDEDSIIDVDDSFLSRVKMNARSAGQFMFGMEKESELEMSKLELAEIEIRKPKLDDTRANRKRKADSTSSEIKRRKYDNCEMEMYQCRACEHVVTERIQYQFNERKLNANQVNLSTLLDLADNRRDVRIDEICRFLTVQDLLRLRRIILGGHCKLMSFSVKVPNGMDKSILEKWFGVAIEEHYGDSRYKLYSIIKDTPVEVQLWYEDHVFYEVFHFESNLKTKGYELKTTIGSEYFWLELIEKDATQFRGLRQVKWNRKYRD